MTSHVVLPNQTVLIKNGIIENLGKTTKLKIPKNYQIIDGKGQFLMPGLTDTHVHFFQEQYADHKNTNELELKMMLANGITTARVMAGHPDYLAAKNKVKNGEWPGPDLIVASPQLAGKWHWDSTFKNYEVVNTIQKATDAVLKFKAEGYDAIKVTFMVEAPVYEAAAKAAKAANIPFIGHVGPQAKLPLALKYGMQIEHMDEFIDQLLPDTSYNHGQSVSDMNVWRMKAWATVPHLMESKIPALAMAVKEAGVYVSPTNYFFISCFGSTDPDEVYKAKPDYGYIPQELLEDKWDIKKRQRDMPIAAADKARYVDLRKKITLALNKAGVPLMAGSDSPEWFLATGFSIHDEIATFATAGLSNFEALKTATVTPAQYFNNNKGTVTKGKAADLLLLDKNPLEKIENTRSIVGIIKAGKYYSTNHINSFLKQAKNLSK
jgi:hypothetical protein